MNADTIKEMHAAFRRGGRKAIDKVMKQQPAIFLKLLVLLVPREMQVEHSGTIKQMSDQQLEDAISWIQQMLAAREAKVIEGVSEPVPTPALPAPQRKRRKAEEVSATEPRTARPRRAEEDVVS